MTLRPLACCLLLCTLLTACNDRPFTAGQVADKLRVEFADENHDVTWINVTPAGKPGKFHVIADRIGKNGRGGEDTLICEASATVSTSSWSCRTASPAIMVQAAEKLKAHYEGRGMKVGQYHLARTGKGNDFAGYFVISAPNDGPVASIPCRGRQNGLDFHLDCNFSFGEAAAKPVSTGGST